LLQDFLRAHISDFEVGHRDLLSEALLIHLRSDDDQNSVRRGFSDALDLMDKWWDALASAS
jgi:hypothetical protein